MRSRSRTPPGRRRLRPENVRSHIRSSGYFGQEIAVKPQSWMTLCLIVALTAARTVCAAVPTPSEFLGHAPGEDYYLATYEEEVAYFHKLAASSDRIKLFTAGKTTQGRTFEYAIISTPQNIAY